MLEEKMYTPSQLALIVKAKENYGDIKPCGRKNSFSECFFESEGTLGLWFNTQDDSSHIVWEDQDG